MNYSNNAFFTLMDEAAAQGADHLDAMCEAKHYELTGDMEIANGSIPSCGQSALFHVPYDGDPDGEGDQAMMSGVTVCAVDDAMGAFPRFGGDKLAKLNRRELFFVHGDKLEKNDPRVTGK